jgi:hypothetical protein
MYWSNKNQLMLTNRNVMFENKYYAFLENLKRLLSVDIKVLIFFFLIELRCSYKCQTYTKL